VGAVLVVAYAWSRGQHLDQSLWYDEVYSVLNYIQPGLRAPWTGYNPNDHILFEQLANLSMRVFGDNEVAYRLPAVVGGFLAIVVVGWWLWREHGVAVALVFSALAVVAPVHLDLSRQARGYGVAFLGAAAMLVAGARALRTLQTRWIVLFALAGLLGALTLPIFVLPLVASAAVPLVEPRLRVRVAIAVAAAGMVIGAYFLPIASAVRAGAQQHFGDQLSRRAVVTGWVDDLAAPSWRLLFPGADNTGSRLHVLVYLASYALAILGARRLWRRGDRLLLGLLVGPVLFTYLVVELARFYTVPRFASYLLFAVLVLVALGIVELGSLAARGAGWQRCAAIALGITAVAVMSVRFVHFTNATAATPYENYKDAAAIADAAPGDTVYTNAAAGAYEGMHYYLHKHLVIVDTPTIERLFCTAAPPLVYVDRYYPEAPPDLSCLRARGARQVTVVQNQAPIPLPGGYLGASMNVWILPGGSR
jgi:hypothetical protein